MAKNNPYKNFVQDILSTKTEFLKTKLSLIDQEFEQELVRFGDAVNIFLKTGEKNDLLIDLLENEPKTSHKENVAQNMSVVDKKRRTNKSVLKDITVPILQIKTERTSVPRSESSLAESTVSSLNSDIVMLPDLQAPVGVNPVHIKTEKLSENLSSNSCTRIDQQNVQIKTEVGEMPAPTQLPPRRKKVKEEKSKMSKPTRSTRTKGRKVSDDKRESVIPIEDSIRTVELTDSDESLDREQKNNKQNENESDTELPKRSTRTKTLRNQTKLPMCDTASEMEIPSRSTRTKTLKKATQQTDEESVSETDMSSRSTRTKNKKKANQENVEEPASETQLPTRSTRTKTIRKAHPENHEEVLCEPDIPVRNTHTGTIKENIKDKLEKSIPEVELPVRSTRTKTLRKRNQENNEENQNTESKEEEHMNVETETRSTRTKTIRKAKNVNDEKNKEIGSKTLLVEKEAVSAQNDEETLTSGSHYEDARSVADSNNVNNATKLLSAGDNPPPIDKILNSTVTVEKPNNQQINSTVIISNPKFVDAAFENHIAENMMTDDESDKEIKITPKKKPKLRPGKEVFSPYEKSSTKKKVEAFEKLTQANKRVTGKELFAKEKAKPFTPSTTKFLPTVCSTSKIHRYFTSQNSLISNDSVISKQGGSALKASQMEFREREKRRQEKEKEALKKKEALLQSITEERKRKREEKQLKAQQQREVLEKEKQKQLEYQKLKDEKARQLMAEREQYLQKQKEDAEKKRLIAKKKAREMAIQKQKQEGEQRVPVYMVTKPPLLPTDDCYDSDDPEYASTRQRLVRPSWARDEHLKPMLLAMLCAGEKMKNTFFCLGPQYPNIEEILEAVDRNRLKRTSSAIWRKPPRYTLMPKLEETMFSEDEED